MVSQFILSQLGKNQRIRDVPFGKRLFLGIISRQIFEYASVDLKYSIKYSGGRPSCGTVQLSSLFLPMKTAFTFAMEITARAHGIPARAGYAFAQKYAPSSLMACGPLKLTIDGPGPSRRTFSVRLLSKNTSMLYYVNMQQNRLRIQCLQWWCCCCICGRCILQLTLAAQYFYQYYATAIPKLSSLVPFRVWNSV